MNRKCKIYIAITTYDRPQEFKSLMDDVLRETTGKDVHIHVYDDNSPSRYSHESTEFYNLTRYTENHGKKGYWRIMNDVFRDAQTWKFDYFFFLQDDCKLTEGFFEKAINEFSEINDQNKATLCTFTPENIYDRLMWSRRSAEDVIFNDRKFIKSNYIDCIFMCPRSTLEFFNFTVESIPPTRFSNQNISSGVGQQLTKRLLKSSKTMYTAYSSLITSHSNDSKMNDQERKINPLNPLIRENISPIILSELLNFRKEPVVCGIASIKSRETILEKTVNSLIEQVDKLYIYLNDYETVPKFLENNPKIKYFMGKVYKDRGDTGKFFALKDVTEGYYFSADDDIIYPENYVEKTIEFLKKNDDKVIATYHGAILKKGILENYYRDRKQVHYAHFQRNPLVVDIGGTGVMAFNVKTFKPDIEKFLYPNMADVWVGIQAKDNNIPIVCAPRPLNWIKAEELPPDQTIYGSKKNHDLQTDMLNKYFNKE